MMENGMKETQDNSAPLRETDEHTFGRFVEFIYTGDYNPAEPVKVVKVLEPTSTGVSEDDEPQERSKTREIVSGERIEGRAFDFDMPQEEPATEDASSEQLVELGFSSFRHTVHRPKKTKDLKKKRKPDWYEPQTLNPEPSSPFPRSHPRSSARLPCPTSDVVIKSAIPTCSMFV
jgi:cell division protein FtsN